LKDIYLLLRIPPYHPHVSSSFPFWEEIIYSSVGSLLNDDGGSIVFYDLQPTHAEGLKNRVESSLSVAEYMSARELKQMD
jgi:hypothetical protein